MNRKRVQRLMRLMGIEAIYPKRRTTWPGAGHKIYPYLLRNVAITRPDQVWSSDITYVPLRHGFLYLVAVMDWYSRYVLAWRLSNTLTGSFCVEALEEALVAGRARDLQHRPRESVHGHGVHVAAGSGRRGDQHGWPRPGDGQRVHRAAVAEREVRGGVPEGLHGRLASGSVAGRRTSASTTTSEFIRRSATARRRRFIASEAQATGRRRTKNELKSRKKLDSWLAHQKVKQLQRPRETCEGLAGRQPHTLFNPIGCPTNGVHLSLVESVINKRQIFVRHRNTLAIL